MSRKATDAGITRGRRPEALPAQHRKGHHRGERRQESAADKAPARLLTDNSIMSAAPPPSFDRRRTETGLHGADSTGNDVTMA